MSSSSSSSSAAGATGNAAPSYRKVYTKEEWERLLGPSKITLTKDQINGLVMNFLVIEGYRDAAESFAKETGVDPGVKLEVLTERTKIRTAIQSGEIEHAIEQVNDLNPELLDSNPKLIFHLKQQRLIELIREGNIDNALAYAQEEMAPRGEENPEFLEELERTMALLAFEDESRCPVNFLLSHSQRQKTAGEVNAAILTSQCQERDARLPLALKMMLWAQQQLSRQVKFPTMDLQGKLSEDGTAPSPSTSSSGPVSSGTSSISL